MGVGSLAFEFGLLLLFKEVVKLDVQIANSAAYFIAFWVNFLLNKFWSFKAEKDFAKQLVKYICLMAFNMGMQYLMMKLGNEILGFDYRIVKIGMMGIIACWNFVIYKKIIYKK